jgi:hypothetical protein
LCFLFSSGELARYWNPAGAAISLGLILMFVLSPISRLMGPSRQRGYGGSNAAEDFDSGGDGGGGK